MIRVLEPNKDYIIRADRNGIVDDVVEVVRCKDCKHNYYNMIPSGEAEHECVKFVELPITADFYCAWGEREDD